MQIVLSGGLFFPDQEQDYTGYNHQAAQHLPHCHSGRNKTEVGIRLPEKFNSDPKNSIKDQENSNHGT